MEKQSGGALIAFVVALFTEMYGSHRTGQMAVTEELVDIASGLEALEAVE